MMDPNIYFREMRPADALALYTMCKDEHLRRSGISHYESEDDALKMINSWREMPEHELFHRAIIERSTESMVGLITLGDMNRYHGYYEIEYAIASEHRNKGYATLALREMLTLAFETHQAQVVAAWVRAHNEASVRVLEKCGLVFEGRLRKHARDKSDTLCYSITKEDWEALRTEK